MLIKTFITIGVGLLSSTILGYYLGVNYGSKQAEKRAGEYAACLAYSHLCAEFGLSAKDIIYDIHNQIDNKVERYNEFYKQN